MDAAALRKILKELGLSQLEAARLLGIKPRTINRWATGSQDASGPAAQALLAWRRLAQRGLAWRPDCVEIRFEPGLHQAGESPSRIVETVTAQGGLRPRWRISLNRRSASAGGLTVYFHRIAPGHFVPVEYRRLDRSENPDRDRASIEEAVAVFARAIENATTRKSAANETRRSLSRGSSPVPAGERAPLP